MKKSHNYKVGRKKVTRLVPEIRDDAFPGAKYAKAKLRGKPIRPKGGK